MKASVGGNEFGRVVGVMAVVETMDGQRIVMGSRRVMWMTVDFNADPDAAREWFRNTIRLSGECYEWETMSMPNGWAWEAPAELVETRLLEDGGRR